MFLYPGESVASGLALQDSAAVILSLLYLVALPDNRIGLPKSKTGFKAGKIVNKEGEGILITIVSAV